MWWIRTCSHSIEHSRFTSSRATQTIMRWRLQLWWETLNTCRTGIDATICRDSVWVLRSDGSREHAVEILVVLVVWNDVRVLCRSLDVDVVIKSRNMPVGNGTVSFFDCAAVDTPPSRYSQFSSSTRRFTLSLDVKSLVNWSVGLTNPLTLRSWMAPVRTRSWTTTCVSACL